MGIILLLRRLASLAVVPLGRNCNEEQGEGIVVKRLIYWECLGRIISQVSQGRFEHQSWRWLMVGVNQCDYEPGHRIYLKPHLSP